MEPTAGDQARVLPYSNVIPRRRDKKGDPLPKRVISIRPLVSINKNALLETAERYGDDPEVAKRHYPWLKARNAIATSDNCVRLREQFESGNEAHNKLLEERAAAMEPTIAAQRQKLATSMVAFAESSAAIPIRFTEDLASNTFAEDEPQSLEEIAGAYGLPVPNKPTSSLYKVIAAICGGAALGINVGLLTGTVELYGIGGGIVALLLWLLVGIGIVTIAGQTLSCVGNLVGDYLYRRTTAVPRLATWFFTFLSVSIMLFALVTILIESRTEQLGLFKALTAESSLQGMSLSRADLLFVSLLLSVPTIGFYLFTGLVDGYRSANLAHLHSLRSSLREAIRKSEAFQSACKLHAQATHERAELSCLGDERSVLESQLRRGLTTEQLYRLEDCEMDAAASSWAAEDALVAPNKAHRTKAKSWFSRLLRRLHEGAG